MRNIKEIERKRILWIDKEEFATGILRQFSANLLPGDIIVTEDESSYGQMFVDIPICTPNILQQLEEKPQIILMPTVYNHIGQHLQKHGYLEGVDYFPKEALLSSNWHKGSFTQPAPGRIAIHFHLYYLDLLEEFYQYFANMPYVFDLLVDIQDSSRKVEVESRFSTLPLLRQCMVRVMPNRGRDVAPLVVGFADVLDNYDFVAHVHSKKSLSSRGERKEWRRYLMDDLFGDSERIRYIFKLFADNQRLGLLFTEFYSDLPYHSFTWRVNKAIAYDAMHRMSIKPPAVDYFTFPGGTMFWARTKALRKLYKSGFTWQDFPVEEKQWDGTLQHAMEIIIPLSVRQSGYDFYVTKPNSNEFTVNNGPKNFQQYFRKNLNEIKAKCDKYDVISFDIFDTLIMRRIARPQFVNEILALRCRREFSLNVDFPSYRREAEAQARRRLQRDVSLTDIYRQMSEFPGMDMELCEKIQAMEVEEEQKLCIPRQTMVDCLRYCHEQGKHVVLTSDMYLEEGQIRQLLRCCGVLDNWYDELYISSATNLRKDNASVWRYFKQRGLTEKMLHIGDNATSDWYLSHNNGIQSYHILSAENLFLSQNEDDSLLQEMVAQMTLTDAVELGLVLARTFSDPFVLQPNGKFQIKNFRDWGYLVYGPVLLRYIIWLDRQARADGCQQLFFMARDGYFLQKLYNKICAMMGDEPLPNTYFLASRRALTAGSVHNISDILDVVHNPFHGSIATCFFTHFGVALAKTEKTEYSLKGMPSQEDMEKIKQVAIANKNVILHRVAEEREGYRKYIEIQDFNMNVKTGIVDIGYAGSLQYYLQKMLHKSNFMGYYFATNPVSKFSGDDKPIRGCFANFEPRLQSKSSVWKYHLYFESILSSPQGQLLYFQKNGNPVFEAGGIPQRKIKELHELYQGVIEYCQDMINTFGNVLNELPDDSNFLDEWIKLMVHKEEWHAKNLCELQYSESNYTGMGITYVFDHFKNE